MKADVLTIVVMVFTLGVLISGSGFISNTNADELPPSALQQGLVTNR